MKRRIGFLFALLFAAAATVAAQGTVCSFDDLSTVANGLGNIPANYCGASWSAPNLNKPLYFSGSYYPFPAANPNYGTLSAHSQPNALYLPFGGAEFIGMSFPAPVVFNGFWATNPSFAPCGSNCGVQLQIILTLGGSLVDTVTVALPGSAYTFISSGYSGQVDGVNINAISTVFGSGGIAIDDVSYNGTCSASIQPNTQVNYPTTGGSGTVAVTAGVGCPWTAASNNSWITVTSGASGVGTGAPQTVTYSVAPNTTTGFQLGSLTVAGLSLPIQEAGVAQFQAQGTAGSQAGTVLNQQPVTFSGTGWQADGGPISVSGGGFAQTFSPPAFAGSFQLAFPSQTSPPCTAQITATQGSISQTVTLTGIYIAKVVAADTAETGFHVGDQICGSPTVTDAQHCCGSILPMVANSAFAVEATSAGLPSGLSADGGSLFFVLNPHGLGEWIGGVLLEPGATMTFPDALGNTITLQADGTVPIVNSLFDGTQQNVWLSLPGPIIPSPTSGGFEVVQSALQQPQGLNAKDTGLYVNGNASIIGGLVGSGFFFATGSITISGNVEFSAVDVLAFAAGGNITFTGPVPLAFDAVPGALKQVAVGADGAVWGINAQQQIFQYQADPGWANIPGALTQIAVGSSTAIWGINAQQQIYRWDPVHSAWVNVPGSLTQIAVGADGDVWGLNSQSSVYHYNAQTGSFSQVAGTLSQIAVGSAAGVYGVNPEGSIYWYNPGTASFQWIAGTIGFTQIAVGADGDVWAVSNNLAYHYDVPHNTMDAAGGATISQVAVGYGGAVLGRDPQGDVFQWNASSQTWVQIPGTLSSVAVGANGSVWGVNASQQIFTTGQVTHAYQGLSWIPGSLSQISVGADGSAWGLNANTVEHFNAGTQTFQPVSGAPALAQLSVGAGADVWGVDPTGNIYQYVAASGTWNSIPGQLSFIDVGANGSVWGINAAGETYSYSPSSQSWINIPGALAQLSVGGDGTVWGINAQQQIYRFNPSSESWVNVPGALMQISVGNANNIWGVNAGQQVYQYNTSTQSWVNIPGAYLVSISVAPDGSVWGVNSVGNLYQWNPSTGAFSFMGFGVSNVVAGNANAVWALNNWGGIFSWF